MKIKFISSSGKEWYQNVRFPLPTEYFFPKTNNKPYKPKIINEITNPIEMTIYSFYRQEDGTIEYREE